MRNSLRSSSFSLEIFLRSGMGEACLIFLHAADDVVDVAVLPLLPPELLPLPLPPLPLYFAGGIGGVVAKLLLLICMLLLLLLAGFISVVRLTLLLLLFMFLTLPLPLLLLLLLANSGVVTRAL